MNDSTVFINVNESFAWNARNHSYSDEATNREDFFQRNTKCKASDTALCREPFGVESHTHAPEKSDELREKW